MDDSGVVVFNVEDFKKRYPEFADQSKDVLNNWFEMACLSLDNTPQSMVKDLDERKLLLYLLICHMATLNKRGSANLGTVTSVTQGKVSASFSGIQNVNWFNQTQYGFNFYQATRKYRIGGRYHAYSSNH